MKNTGYKIFLLPLLFLYSFNGYTQNPTIDSLRAILNTGKKDTGTVTLLNNLTNSFLRIANCDSGLYYSNQAIKMADALKNKLTTAKAMYFLASSLKCKEDYAKAYTTFLEAKKLFQESNDKLFESKCLTGLASLFNLQGRSNEALENYFSALSICEKIKDTLEIMSNLRRISNIFFEGKKYDLALRYAKKCEVYAYSQKDLHQKDMITELIGDIYQALNNDSLAIRYQLECLHLSELQNDIKGIGDSYIHLGLFYKKVGKFEESHTYFVKAEQQYRQANYLSGISFALFDNALCYREMDRPEMALPLLLKSLQIDESMKDTAGMADDYSNIGRTYLQLKQYENALQYFQTHLILSQKINNSFKMADAYENLSLVYEKLNTPKEALNNFKQFVYLKDSLDKNKQEVDLSGIEAKINFEKAVEENKSKQAREALQTKIKIYSLIGILIFIMVFVILLYRNNKQKQKAKNNIEKAFSELKSTQAQLIQSEKMASLGELTAGIAHEIQNPLNFVNNFSEVSNELLDEMKTELDEGNTEEAKSLADDVKQNLEKILHHGKRADGIVKGMLQHSRSSSGQKESTDINALADEYLRLAYHGLRAKDKSFNAAMKTDYDESIGLIKIMPQDMGRVILNLITNAFYAVTERKKLQPEGYEPVVSVATKKLSAGIEISVKDNGTGIPQKVLDKIFQPFFTTKPTGQGTGLGLSLSYDIVKAHGGELKVETKEGQGTIFIISIPVNQS